MEAMALQKLLLVIVFFASFWLGWFLLWRKLKRIEAMLRKIRAALHFEAEKTRQHASNLFSTQQTRQPKYHKPKPKHLRVVVSHKK